MKPCYLCNREHESYNTKGQPAICSLCQRDLDDEFDKQNEFRFEPFHMK